VRVTETKREKITAKDFDFNEFIAKRYLNVFEFV
jgi:hypothetical protein